MTTIFSEALIMCCRVVPLLLAVTGVAGCSIFPWYSHSNKESVSATATAPVPRPVENFYRAVSLRPALPTDVPSGAGKASIETVPWNIKAACRTATAPPGESIPEPCRDDRFVSLAISGGGSRASIFAAAVMFELQRYGLLEHVDLVSCVSGGCLTAVA